jgi:asparagine synthase (glutamine-hydrolysing)
MTEILRHRGPDGQGFHLAPGIGLGVRRLAIVDLETGDQPIRTPDESVSLVCNGEIYNFLELRAELQAAGHRFQSGSDVEVIVHLYEEFGIECLRRLRGMFALALWDARRRRLLLARDRLGIKPLFYALVGEGLLFGSEQKAILMAGLVERALDPRALDDVFNFGFITGQQTLFRAIRHLPPGHLLLYQDGRASLQRYWDPDTLPRQRVGDPRSAGEWAEALRDKLTECVRLHLRSDVPVGAYLSPGVDSSGVASLMGRLASDPVPVFSMGFEQPEVDELARNSTLDQYPGYNLAAERVTCTAADFEQLPRALWHAEDPSAGTFAIVGHRLGEAAARRVKVVLAGEGSDELFGGYPWYLADRQLAALAPVPPSLRRLLARLPFVAERWPTASWVLQGPATLDRERYRRLISPLDAETCSPLFSAELRRQIAALGDSDEGPALPADFARWSRFERMQHFELTVRLPGVILRLLDRHSMAHSLEARVPFLDHELVELCARIPTGLKLKGRTEKYILRRAVQGLLPPEIAWRRKRGLRAPTESWLVGKLPDFAAEQLTPEALRRTGYFEPTAVATLRTELSQGRRRHAPQLAGVLSVQLWDELLRQGCQPPV